MNDDYNEYAAYAATYAAEMSAEMAHAADEPSGQTTTLLPATPAPEPAPPQTGTEK